MNDEKIKSIVKRYRNISFLWLSLFYLFAITANWFLTRKNIAMHFESGLDYVTGEQGFKWGAILCGLWVVLILFFYSLENILLAVNKENRDKD